MLLDNKHLSLGKKYTLLAQLIPRIIGWGIEPGKLMIWQNYCLETLSRQHVSQMEILAYFLYTPVQILPYS